MTVSSESTGRKEYTGNGSLTTYAYDFLIFADTDLKVYVAGTLQTLTTDYTITGAGDDDGGNVEFVSAPANAAAIVILADIPLTQESDFQANVAFPAETMEDAVDRLTRITQQLSEKLNRAMLFAESSTFDSIALPDPVADTYLGWDNAGTGLQNNSTLPTDTTTISAFVITLLDDANAAAFMTTMGITSFIQTLLDDTTAAGARETLGVSSAKNFIVNSQFRVMQEATSITAATTPANNDDTYCADQWILLSDGNDVVDISQETTIRPDGAYSALKLLVATANKKFGILQPLEGLDAASLRGKTVSLSFEARTTTGAVIENIRAAVVSWDGTIDAITSDIISDWAVEGTNPTFATNWTAENTAADMAVTADAFAVHSIKGISVDTSGMNNLGLFIWVDDTDAALNDVLYISKVRLELGSAVTAYEADPFQRELDACQRFCYTIDAQSTPDTIGTGQQINTTNAEVPLRFPVQMRGEPALTISDASHFGLTTGAPTLMTASTVTIEEPSNQMALIDVTWTGASGAAGDCVVLATANASAKLTFSARL